MRNRNRSMCCLVTTKGVIFTDKERLEEGRKRREQKARAHTHDPCKQCRHAATYPENCEGCKELEGLK